MSERFNKEKTPLPFSTPKGTRNGLVLGGGGAKGCYHVGVWQAFKEHGLSFQGVAGTSIGALVGCFYVQQNIEPVTDFVMGMTPEEIAMDLPHMPHTIREKVKGTRTVLEFIVKYMDDKMDITPLKNHFDQLFDFDQFQSSDIAYGCMTYNDTLGTGRGFVKEEITRENAMDIIMASAACYPAFPKVEMDGQLYMDGGYAANVPIELLYDVLPDPDQIVVVDIHVPQEPAAPALTEDMFLIQPILHPGSSLDFSTLHASRLYDQGYLEALKYLDQNPGYLYTFRKEDAPLMDVVETYLDRQMEQKKVQLPFNDAIAKMAVSSVLGYTPYELGNTYNKNYDYGKLVEALGILAKVEPVSLRDYRQFLGEMIDSLGTMKFSNTEDNDYKMVEIFTNLKKEELTVRLHRLLVRNQGYYPAAVEMIKDKIPVSYTMAYIWYFIEELVRNLPSSSQSQEKKVEEAAADARRQ